MIFRKIDHIRSREIGDITDDCLAEVVAVNKLAPGLQVTTLRYLGEGDAFREHMGDRDLLLFLDDWYAKAKGLYDRIFSQKQA